MTPFPDVNRLALDLLTGARAILGDQLVGLYLYGSLATGDFDPTRSDVDVLVATRGATLGPTSELLADLHRRVPGPSSPWAIEVEATYAPLDLLRRHDPELPFVPHISRGEEFGPAQLHVDWVIQRHVLREHAIVVAGPPPRDLIDPVTPEEIRHAAAERMREVIPFDLDDQRWALRGPMTFRTLTYCRVLHTVETGEVTSKQVAARWARPRLERRFWPLVDRALAWRKTDPQDDVRPEEAVLAKDLGRYLLSHLP